MESQPNLEEGVYFWINPDEPEETRCPTVICESCHEDHPHGWHWPGHKGYGPFDIICKYCGKVVHKGQNE